MIHVAYGQGVGKTSRAVGLAVRAAGAGLKVNFVQFMKSGDSGEVAVLRLIPSIFYKCPGRHPFVLENGPEKPHFEHARKALKYANAAVVDGADVLVCDEILNALLFKILKIEQVLELVEKCRGRLELVMTGSHAPPEIVEAADYATEFIQSKHPYYSGVPARIGIEF